MTYTNRQIVHLLVAAIIFRLSEGGVFFPKSSSSSSILSPGIKDYPFPVKLVKVTNTVAVPVPYPVHVTKKVPYPVTVTKPVPYPVPHPVPIHITKPILIRQAIPVPVVKPFALPQPLYQSGPSSSSLLTSHLLNSKNPYLNYYGYNGNPILHGQSISNAHQTGNSENNVNSEPDEDSQLYANANQQEDLPYNQSYNEQLQNYNLNLHAYTPTHNLNQQNSQELESSASIENENNGNNNQEVINSQQNSDNAFYQDSDESMRSEDDINSSFAH